MGFCRRCGEIVAGTRCKCGGTAAAPVVPWNQSKPVDAPQDKWSKIYVQRARSVSPIRSTASSANKTPQISPTKRFPRPITPHTSSNYTISNQVSEHIASSTSYIDGAPFPVKYLSSLPASDSDILPSLHDTTLSKVYGSVLQPKESLTTHSCATCSSPFPPDATIYPDPTNLNTSRFLCRPCYEANGGTKGICPSCSRPVLTLKSEGGFIHAAGQYWHKRCFNCSGCFKNIGDTPMVDLLGRPSCAKCFENCLKRDPVTPKKYKSNSINNSPRPEKNTNPGGMSSGYKGRKSREGSPTIEELEQRLGIVRIREESPALEDLSQGLALLERTNSPKHHNNGTTIDYDQSKPFTARSTERRDTYREKPDAPNNSPATMLRKSPARTPNSASYQAKPSPTATPEAVEEMKQRFMRSTQLPSFSQTPPPAPPVAPHLSPLRLSRSSISSPKFNLPDSDYSPSSPLSPSIPPTPDMLSDFSDTMTQSSLGSDSPPGNNFTSDAFTSSDQHYSHDYNAQYPRVRDFYDGAADAIVEETSSQLGTPTRTPSSTRAATTPTKGSVITSSPESPLEPKLAKGLLSLPLGLSPGSCSGCGGSILSVKGGGKYVTVPIDGTRSATYHVNCFRCMKCDGVFGEPGSGQTVFVKAQGGACHVECAPPAKIIIHKTPSLGNLSTSPAPAEPQAVPSKPSPKLAMQPSYRSSSRLEQLPLTRPPTNKSSPFPRFGGSLACPGCNKAVSPMEQGVVPGPASTRWHASCLVCGGKRAAPKGSGTWRSREVRKTTEPGCGKRLDSAAKTSAEGGIWCRECLLLLGGGSSPQISPTRSPLVPSFTGITPQFTGTTTLARQFTGLGGGGDPGLLRQLTGGSVSPTRSISPTKQLGGGMRPRPKSVIGMRSTKSIDEGRGMFLVKQLTGAS